MDRINTLQLPPHVLIFPFQLQGHINPMLKLAELLCLAGLHVTFLVSDNTHHLLLRHNNIQSRFARFPGFHLESISDGMPAEHCLSGSDILRELFISIETTVKPLFKELLILNRLSSESQRPLNCIIADWLFSFAIDLGEEIGIPVIYFSVGSASYFWTLFCLPKLIDAGELPFNGSDLDEPIKNVVGMEGFLRRRDLPSWCRTDEFQVVLSLLTETQQTRQARGLILDTFEDLEGPILSHIRTQIPNVYTIGPLHGHLKARLGTEMTPAYSSSSSNLWEENRSCLTWLDEQPLKSVIYVSFGSITVMTRDQLIEFWHGLVNSGWRFLWVVRPDLVAAKDGESPIPAELQLGTKARGYTVGWAPQEEVLAHSSVGGFLTHSGWNSTLESIAAGVPMICWPYFADQQLNSRLVSEVWKVGLDMKDTCDRVTVEKMIKDLMMEVEENKFMISASRMAKLARNAVGDDGGLSYCNLARLVEDISLMSSTTST